MSLAYSGTTHCWRPGLAAPQIATVEWKWNYVQTIVYFGFEATTIKRLLVGWLVRSRPSLSLGHLDVIEVLHIP